MLTGLLRLIAQLPLAWLHAAGSSLGWLVYLTSPGYASRLRDNLLQSRCWHDEADYQRVLHANITESGKAVGELPAIWFRPQAEIAAWVRSVRGWEWVERARAAGKGLILLTPHLGCFEAIPHFLTTRFPMTVLYRPPRFRALDPAMRAGRERAALNLASTDLKGVRTLLKTLKSGGVIGMLPDQVPSAGDGEWATFFDRPAYTATLTGRLAQNTGAAVVLTWAQRLPGGQGYTLYFESMPEPLTGETPTRQLNRAIEAIVRRCPEQYLWSYNRYKRPGGAPAAAGDPPC